MRKFDPIDLMKLYSKGSNNGWNEFLLECVHKLDINKLAKVRYQICAGMDDLAKAKLNTPEIDVWFVRLSMSLEKTARQILRIKHPLKNDDPLRTVKTELDHHQIKKKRDQELAKFMKDSNY